MKRKFAILCSAITIFCASNSLAQDYKFELVTGMAHAPYVNKKHQDFEYQMTSLRAGLELLDFDHGNIEGLMGATFSNILKGWGSYMAGIDLLVRYNIETDHRFKPYIQAGVGILYNDAYKEDQPYIGQAREYSPQAVLGLDYLVNDYFLFGLEVGHHHISNKSEHEENDGTDALTCQVKITLTKEGIKKIFKKN